MCRNGLSSKRSSAELPQVRWNRLWHFMGGESGAERVQRGDDSGIMDDRALKFALNTTHLLYFMTPFSLCLDMEGEWAFHIVKKVTSKGW